MDQSFSQMSQAQEAARASMSSGAGLFSSAGSVDAGNYCHPVTPAVPEPEIGVMLIAGAAVVGVVSFLKKRKK